VSFVWSTVSENVGIVCRVAVAVGSVNGDFKTLNGEDKGDGLTGAGAGCVHAVRPTNPMPSRAAMLRQKKVNTP
jgi:hypothetical protein